MRSLGKFFKDIVNQWLEDEPFSLAAALSYYTLFSLAPLLIIAFAVAGFVFGREAAQNQVVETLQGLVGQQSAQAIQTIIEEAGQRPKAGAFSTAFGIAMLLFGAGGVVGQLQLSLNKIWGVAPKRAYPSGHSCASASYLLRWSWASGFFCWSRCS